MCTAICMSRVRSGLDSRCVVDMKLLTTKTAAHVCKPAAAPLTHRVLWYEDLGSAVDLWSALVVAAPPGTRELKGLHKGARSSLRWWCRGNCAAVGGRHGQRDVGRRRARERMSQVKSSLKWTRLDERDAAPTDLEQLPRRGRHLRPLPSTTAGLRPPEHIR